MSPRSPPGRRPLWRFLARDILGPVLALGALAGALWVARVPLVEALAPWALARAGFGPAALTVAALEPDRLDLRDVRLGGGRVIADRITATYTPEGLARGRIESVTVSGADAALAWAPDTGLDAGPFNALLRSGGGGGTGRTPDLPFDGLRLNDLRVTLDTPWGSLRALGDGGLDTTGAEPEASADVTVSGAGLFAVVQGRGRPWPTPAFEAVAMVQAEERDRPGLARGLAGRGTLRLDWRDGLLSLTADSLALRADAVDPALLAPLHPALAALAEGPLNLRVEPVDGGEAPRLSLPLALGTDPASGPPQARGRLRLETARLAVTAEGRVSGVAARPRGTVDLNLRVRDAVAPVLGSGIGVDAAGRLTFDDAGLVWRAVTPLRVTAPDPEPALVEALASGLGAPPVLPLDLTVSAREGGEAWRATLTPEPNVDGPAVWAVDLDGAVTARDAGSARASLSARLEGRASPVDGLGTARIRDLTITAEGVAPMGLRRVTAGLSSPRLDLRDGRVTGTLRARADAAGLETAGLLAGPIHLTAAGTVALSPSRAEVTLNTGALEIAAARATGGAWTGPSLLSLALTRDRRHVVILDRMEDGAPALTLGLALQPVDLTGTVTGRVEGVTAAGRLPPVPGAPFALSATVSRARLADWRVSTATADLTLTPDGPTLDVTAVLPDLPGEPPAPEGERHPLRPLRVRGTVSPDAETTGRLRVDAAIGAPFRATLASARGWISADGRDGRLVLAGTPLPLGNEGVQPWHLHGALVDLSTREGTVGLQGTLAWRNGGRPRPELLIGLVDVGAAYGAIRLHKLNGVVHLTDLAPLTAPPQDLVAGGLDMGVPFTDLEVTYHIDGEEGAFVLDGASMRLADGDITVSEALVPLAGFDRVPLTLTVEGLDLAELAALTPVDGLTISGEVNGRLPLVLTPGAVRVDAGRLATIGPGVVRYTGEALPEGMQGVDLARRALENFQYSDLSLTLNGDTRDDMAMAVRLDGANDAVLDGYPFQINLSVSGPLTRLLQEGLQGYTIPQRITEKLRSMGLDPGSH
ncbi:intermembrane phospholipid transport protein YdbH family protein [Rhodospira trueperi]|uniref:intermembrane phospholipid transport protein YdbH family protein n=1 Tax=Rhodospira trueperi TaxID=69960 RepID=UPI00115FF2FE|nr:YdbH domain-containing protein [Rhodospira trueperi]